MSDPFEQLGAELETAARRQLRPRATATPWWRRPRLLVVLAGGVTGLGGAALATAALLGSGAPVGYQYGAPPTADRHFGVTVPGSVKTLTDDVPDPAGGLPWGMRTFTTSRGYGCVQIGRVQDGKLGVLALQARDGAVVERGLFHELRPAVLRQATNCAPLDGARHLFLALRFQTSTDGVPPHCGYRSAGMMKAQTCKDPDQRMVDAGLLGPRATRVVSRDGTRLRVLKTLGSAGGYLIVRHEPRPRTKPVHFGLRPATVVDEGQYVAATPSTPDIARVEYRGAPACDVHTTATLLGSCGTPPGYVTVRAPSARDVRARVVAFAAPDRRRVRIRFTARVAVHDARSDYDVLVRFPRGRCHVRHLSLSQRRQFYRRNGGDTCSGDAEGFTLDRDVRAGERISTTFTLPSAFPHNRPPLRPGRRYRVVVRFKSPLPHPAAIRGLSRVGALVGTASFVVPR